MKTITKIIADGLDASVDGRGFGAEHLAAVKIADAAPEMLRVLRKIALHTNSGPHTLPPFLADEIAVAIAKAEP